MEADNLDGFANPDAAVARNVLRLLATALLTIAVLIPVVIAVRGGAHHSFFDKGLTGFGMWGVFALHMWTRPTRGETILTVAIGLVLRAAYAIAIGEHGYPGFLLIGLGTFLGLASLMVMTGRCLGAAGERRDVARRSMGAVAVMTYIGFCLGFYLIFATLVLPRKLDYYLYNFDGALGFQASFLAGRLLDRWRPLFRLETEIYNCFGFWFSVVLAAHCNSRTKYPVNVMKMLVSNALIGFSLYFLYPAMGPRFACASFPDLPGAVQSPPILAAGFPNAMPSLHFGGALILTWFCKPWKWLYRIMIGFTALTALATLGLGEHYLIDLVVAFPYALAMLPFSSRITERKLPLYTSALMVGLWLTALRFVHFSPALAWTSVLTTIAVTLFLERRLAAHLWAAEPR